MPLTYNPGEAAVVDRQGTKSKHRYAWQQQGGALGDAEAVYTINNAGVDNSLVASNISAEQAAKIKIKQEEEAYDKQMNNRNLLARFWTMAGGPGGRRSLRKESLKELIANGMDRAEAERHLSEPLGKNLKANADRTKEIAEYSRVPEYVDRGGSSAPSNPSSSPTYSQQVTGAGPTSSGTTVNTKLNPLYTGGRIGRMSLNSSSRPATDHTSATTLQKDVWQGYANSIGPALANAAARGSGGGGYRGRSRPYGDKSRRIDASGASTSAGGSSTSVLRNARVGSGGASLLSSRMYDGGSDIYGR